jgi:hypothetical protein
VLDLLADTLLDPNFEAQLAEQHPLERDVVPGSRSEAVPDAFELITYQCNVTIDDTDPRKQEEHRTATLRLLLPYQRVVGIRYYSYRSPPSPEKDGVTVLSKGHTYLGTLPDPIDGSPGRWWMHFIHLGQRKKPDDEVVIETQERYFDKDARSTVPHHTLRVRSESLRTVKLGVRLPANRRAEAKPVARVIADPYDSNVVVDEWKLMPSKDGWVHETFDDCKVGFQYGIFFPGIDLYAK